MSIKVIENSLAKIEITKIRNKDTESSILQKSLYTLGQIVSGEIIADVISVTQKVITPMNYEFIGLAQLDQYSIVISTKDDYEFFAKGLASQMEYCLCGYMDFAGQRGPSALTSSIRAIELPDPPKANKIHNIIIAKSVLATGCTAISITKKAIEKYSPKNLVIASVFYSIQGIQELSSEFPNSNIYVFGDPDKLDADGYLIPGIGNIDIRLRA